MSGILITGGLGYIGGRIADYIGRKSPDAEVILSTSRKDYSTPDWAKSMKIRYINLLDRATIEKSLDGVETVIHLAALNEIDSMKNIEMAMNVNVIGTFNLISEMRKKDIDKFVYFSTIHVYGDIYNKYINEDSPTRPFHPYATTHRAAEDIVNYFKHYDNIKALIFRLSNGMGYPMDGEVNRWTLVFNDLCRQAIASGRIVLKTSGRQHRDFITLYDVCRAVHHFLYTIPDEWGDGLYNLGGECSMSIMDSANLVANVYRKRYRKNISSIEKADSKDDNQQNPINYDINKLKQKGFVLKGDMKYEIEETLKVCEEKDSD